MEVNYRSKDASPELLQAIEFTVTVDGVIPSAVQSTQQAFIEWVLKNVFEQKPSDLANAWSILIETLVRGRIKNFYCECIYQVNDQSKLLVRTQDRIHQIDPEEKVYVPFKKLMSRVSENYRGVRRIFGSFPVLNALNGLIKKSIEQLPASDKALIKKWFKPRQSIFMPLYAVSGEFRIQPEFQLTQLQVIDFTRLGYFQCRWSSSLDYMPQHLKYNDFSKTPFSDDRLEAEGASQDKQVPWINRYTQLSSPQEDNDMQLSRSLSNAGVFLLVYLALAHLSESYLNVTPRPWTVRISLGVLGGVVSMPLFWMVSYRFKLKLDFSDNFINGLLRSPSFATALEFLQGVKTMPQINHEASHRRCGSLDRPMKASDIDWESFVDRESDDEESKASEMPGVEMTSLKRSVAV